MAARHKITWRFGLVALCADEVCTEVCFLNDLAQATICADGFFPGVRTIQHDLRNSEAYQ